MLYQALLAATAALICGLFQMLFSYISEQGRLKRFETSDASIPRFCYKGRYYNLYRYVRDKANSLDSKFLKDKTIPEIIDNYEKKVHSGKDSAYNAAIISAYKLLAYERNKSYPEAQIYLSDPPITKQPDKNEFVPKRVNASTDREGLNQEEFPKRTFCRYCGQRIDENAARCNLCGKDLTSESENTNNNIFELIGKVNNRKPEKRQIFRQFSLGKTSNHQNINSVADELRMYKQLLDEGVITQEDYDLKKRQILSKN